MKATCIWIVAAFIMLVLVRPAGAACTITTTPVSFGLYDPFGAGPNDSTGTLTYRCGPPDRNITIVLGTGAAGSFNPRTLLDGTEPLNYNLYRNAARTVRWGDGTGSTSFYFRADPPNNRNVVLTIYGRIPANQDVSAGTYTDTVSVIVNF